MNQWLAGCVAAVLCGSAVGQDRPPSVEPLTHAIESTIEAVTAYRNRAAVTRRATLELERGVHALVFEDLPARIDPGSIQARLSPNAKVLGVDFEQRALVEAETPRLAELDDQIRSLRDELAAIERQFELIASQETFLDALTNRIEQESGDRAATTALDLDAIRRQYQFLTEEWGKLLEQRGRLEADKRRVEAEYRALEERRSSIGSDALIDRNAIVSVAVIEPGLVEARLVYLVRDATWQPTYNIRAATDGSLVEVEYEALLAQRTGEDWRDVELTLSTAQPTVAANPPTLEPWYVDVQAPAATRAPARLPAAEYSAAPPAPPSTGLPVEGLAADAELGGGGPSVTYALPRLVSVDSDARRQQRTRIASIPVDVDFIHVAVPTLTDAVHIRGDLTNQSNYQLLPGKASIFVGQDYVGPTRLSAVAPGGSFELYFGIDQAVTVSRLLVSKQTSKTGLLGGGRRTSFDFRIQITNDTGKPLALELWDRHPVSRTDRIQIELTDLSIPLASDTAYTEEDQPRGMLKWELSIPPANRSGNPFVVSYGVRVNRSKDVDITPLPD
jgi:uncharacterized protein (TIGR02231 family)